MAGRRVFDRLGGGNGQRHIVMRDTQFERSLVMVLQTRFTIRGNRRTDGDQFRHDISIDGHTLFLSYFDDLRYNMRDATR
jgi:hypothetical protein